MKIEIGKYYAARDGSKVGPMRLTDTEDAFAFGEPHGLYLEDGSFGYCEQGTHRCKCTPLDLISECTDEPKEVGTLAELNVQQGDIIIYAGDDATPENKPRVYRGSASNGEHYDYDQEWQGSISIRPDGPWRIISRAKPTGPVHTVTRTVKEIVPGVYDRLEVGTMGPTAVPLRLPYLFYNADDVDKLLAHLTAIRDALVENEG